MIRKIDINVSGAWSAKQFNPAQSTIGSAIIALQLSDFFETIKRLVETKSRSGEQTKLESSPNKNDIQSLISVYDTNLAPKLEDSFQRAE